MINISRRPEFDDLYIVLVVKSTELTELLDKDVAYKPKW
jgi:hypothetical protein